MNRLLPKLSCFDRALLRVRPGISPTPAPLNRDRAFRQTYPRIRSLVTTVFATLFAFASPGVAQTFLTEWTAAAQGGVSPVGLALSTETGVTYLYVADHPRNRVIKFNTATGVVTATFGQLGSGNGDFNAPYGIARDPVSGDFYVSERGNHRISRITSSGAFVMAWGSMGSAQGQFNEPVGVTVDAAGDVYVTDHLNHRVQKFRISQTAGVWSAANQGMWGTQGSGTGQFNRPYGITADAAGNIWVADGLNGRVQRFNTSGIYQSTLGGPGTAPGQFIVATGVGVAPGGDVFVTSTNSNPQDGALADVQNQWVSRFTAAGVFTSRFGGTFGQASGQFRLPFSAAVGSDNRIYIADYYNNRVQIFDLTGGGPDTTAPAIASFTSGATTATSVTFQINFSESVTGVNSADFAAVTTGGAVATIGAVAGSGASYTVPVTFTGMGTVQLNLNASGTGIIDAANNAIAVGATGPIYTIPIPGTDTTAPTVASFTVGTSNATSVNFLLNFSESVTGVNATDFATVTTGGASATIGAVTGSGVAYTIPVSYTGTGTVRLNLNATGTGIADAASNALAGGATGPLFTIGTDGVGTTTGTQVIGVTPPTNGTYEKNDKLTFIVRFNGNVTISGGRDDDNDDGKGKRDDDDDDDDDDSSAYFTWTAVGPNGQSVDSGKAQYVSGSGTNALTFSLKVHNGDMAPAGILLGNVIRLDDGAVIRDASGAALDTSRLTLPWTQNPLTGVIFNAPKPGNGNGNGNNGNGNAGNNGNNGNGKGKERSDRLVNISSRLRVTGGDASRSVVAGFVVTGNASKQVLIRAVGPGLAGFGVRDALGEPVLVLRDATGKTIAENDGWKNHPGISLVGDQVGAFRLNAGSRDAALLVTLAPGSYTAQVTANGNGVVLMEIYDTMSGTQLTTEQIVNISTRGFVGTGDDVLVAGFVVTGNTPKRVLIRGLGPALGAFGVPGVLADPILRLYSGGGSNPIAQNDNWETPQPVGSQVPTTAADITAASTAAGAFPLGAGGKDAAILITLPAGSYSVVVSGVGNGTGAGIVEVYEVQ